MALKDQNCEHIAAGTPPLNQDQVRKLMNEIPGWDLSDSVIQREFQFKDFEEAMDVVNQIADLAEQQDHHPDIHISYNKVKLELSTHRIGGLSRNDFILAAKINQMIDNRVFAAHS